MSTKPSEIIEQAADRLENCAAGTTASPWREYYDGGIYSVAGPNGQAVCTDVDQNGDWIALMSPTIAGPLAALLRSSTGYWRLYENRGWAAQKVRAQVGQAALDAFALAEVITGVSS